MKEISLIVLYWLHLVASTIWIGGIFFILYAAIPSAREVLGKEAGKLMGVIGRRFTPFANYAILILILSGIFMAVLKDGASEVWMTDIKWIVPISLKVFIVLAMVTVHFYRGLVLIPKIGKMTSELAQLDEGAKVKASQRAAYLQRLSLNLVKVNLALGMAVLLFSSIAATV